MERFDGAKTIRLKGPHGKYLWAEEENNSVTQNEEAKNERALWHVERNTAGSLPNTLRFRSCFDVYLAACNTHFHDVHFLGFSGKRIAQVNPAHVQSTASLDWEPVIEKGKLKLKSCFGTFLRGNSHNAPWNDSVSHDNPRHADHEGWLYWEVETVRTPRIIPAKLVARDLDKVDIEQVPFDGRSSKADATSAHSRLRVSS